MSKAQFSLSRFLAKYWLETAIGTIAVLVLLVGIVISQTGRRADLSPGYTAAQSAPVSALAVLSGKPSITLDVVKVGDQKLPFRHTGNAKLTLREGQSVEFSGWAIDPVAKSAPSAAFIQVGDFARAQASQTERADVAAVYKVPEYEKSGFDVIIPPALLTRGTHRLAFLVENGPRTGYYVEPNWLTVVVVPGAISSSGLRQLPGVPNYSLDQVEDGGQKIVVSAHHPAVATVSGNDAVKLEGWVIDSSTNEPARGISAVVDGQKVVNGVYGSTRADVATAYGNAALRPSGFVITFPPRSLAKGTHDVSLRIVASDGTGYYLVRDGLNLTVQ